MASLSQDAMLQQMPQDFSNFLDSVITISGAEIGGKINNIADFNKVISSFIEKLQAQLTDDSGEILLPDGITKTKIKSFLTKKAQSPDGKGIHMIGGIMMANICRDKLMSIADKTVGSTGLSELVTARIKAIFTKGFVEDFSQNLPFRETTSEILRRGTQAQNDQGDDDNDNSDGSYTKFFNELFKVTQGRFKWRANIFAPVSNDLQCLRAHSDGNPASVVHEMHQAGTLKCYICGRQIKSLGGTKGQWKMQCEHILPIITALAHWWLVKPLPGERTPRSLTTIYSDEQVAALKEEYEWSHACCNLVKNNWELINIGPDGCSANTRGISYLLQAIWEGSNPPSQFDCAEVNKTTKNGLFNLSTVPWPGNFKASQYCKQQRDAIIKRIRKLTTTINANIINTNNFQVYTLLTKFRVMSAISDDNFMQLLINSIDEDHTQALTEAVQGAINMQKAIVNAAIKRCNDNIIKAGQLGATINTIEKSEDELLKAKMKNEEEIAKLDRSQRARGQAERDRNKEELNVKNQEIDKSLSALMIHKETVVAQLRECQMAGPGYESGMMTVLLNEYLEKHDLDNANEFLYQKSNETWDWSGNTSAPNRYMGEDEKRQYINDIKLSIHDVRDNDEAGEEEGEGEGEEIRESEERGESKYGEEEGEEERLSREQSERRIAEIFSPETVQFVLRRSTRKGRFKGRYSGGRIPNSAVDTVNIVNPNVIIPSPNIKPDPSVIVPSPDIKPKINVEVLSNDASGLEIKPIVKSYSDEDINRGADALIQLGLDIRNSIIFANLLEKVEGPTLDDIKNQLLKMFTQEDNSNINEISKAKLKKPIDEDFVNKDFNLSGGKTRKRQRKSKKKTRKKTNKRRKRKVKKVKRKRRGEEKINQLRSDNY